MKHSFRIALIFLLALAVTVENGFCAGSTVAYSKTNIVIMRRSVEKEAPPPLPWQGDAVPADNPGVIFDVEIRDASTLYAQSGWYNLSGPSEKSGVMLMFDQPQVAPIVPSSQYAPLDILFIDAEGTILQIAPNIMMAALEQNLVLDVPVKAFLFLKGGTCEIMQIQPGDHVLYKMFKQPPKLLTAPGTPAPASAPKAAVPVMQPMLPPKAATEQAEKPQGTLEDVVGKEPAEKDVQLKPRAPSGPLMIQVP